MPPPVHLAPEPGPILAGAPLEPPETDAAGALTVVKRRRFNPLALKPLTYGVMHLCVAVTVAYLLTGDWRIALGVGVIEPMVQTVAYTLHEKAWSRAGMKRQGEAGAGSGLHPA